MYFITMVIVNKLYDIHIDVIHFSITHFQLL